VERLERRDCPTGPTITLEGAVLANHQVQLSGTVIDDDPSTVTIYFSGVAWGSTKADASGNYSYTTSPTSLGNVYAWGMDSQQLTSILAMVQLTKPAPTITLAISYGSQKNVTLSGTVTDLDAGGRTVNFSNTVARSVVTSADGTFRLTTQAVGRGTIQAFVMDLWGQSATPAQVNVTSNAPVISDFVASEGTNNYWTFTGKVTDESAAGLTVTLGGVTGLDGSKVTVQADGTFSFTIQLEAGVSGTAMATVTDWWGLTSNTAMCDLG
jgi:hypothetical protein